MGVRWHYCLSKLSAARTPEPILKTTLNARGNGTVREPGEADSIFVGVVAAVDRRAQQIVEVEIEARAAGEIVRELEIHRGARRLIQDQAAFVETVTR